MYKFIRFFKNSMGWECVEFSTPSGKIKKRLITKTEKEKIIKSLNNEFELSNILYNIV